MITHKDHHVPVTTEPLVIEGMMYSFNSLVYLMGHSLRGETEKHFLGQYCKGEVTWPKVRITVELLSGDDVIDKWDEKEGDQ